ncbi:MAG: M36 family metallopeptidase [Saprospiraceae bacterium]
MKNLLAFLAFLSVYTAILAQQSPAVTIATQYLRQQADALGLTAADVSQCTLSSEVYSSHNAVTHVYWQQTYEQIPLHNAILNLNVLKNGEVKGIGNRFVPDLASRVNATIPQIPADEAIRAALAALGQQAPDELVMISNERHHVTFEHAGWALEPVAVDLMYQLMPDQKVRLVWNVSYYQIDAQHWWQLRVDALSGALLDKNDWVTHCSFDHPCESREHHHAPTFMATQNAAATLDGQSAYNVFPLLVESPNHGERTLLNDPFDLVASPFGWHDTDGIPGHEYTITRGNNVHAYHDIFDQNESAGGEPDGGDQLNFDFPLDLSLGRPYTQLDAATTNLFYWNNIVHDVWYQYGFDEAAGNFQVTNYSGIGEGDDYVRAEALDGSGTNNANFATPTDGNRPRMQMYLWGGDLPTFAPPSLEVTAPAQVAGNIDFVQASFGADLPGGTEPIEVVLVDDGTGTTSDACELIVNDQALVGKVALIDRGGGCQFSAKALRAQEAGAIAVIICNNDGSDIFAMGTGDAGNAVEIPSLMISLADCLELKLAMPGVFVRLTSSGLVVPLQGLLDEIAILTTVSSCMNTHTASPTA